MLSLLATVFANLGLEALLRPTRFLRHDAASSSGAAPVSAAGSAGGAGAAAASSTAPSGAGAGASDSAGAATPSPPPVPQATDSKCLPEADLASVVALLVDRDLRPRIVREWVRLLVDLVLLADPASVSGAASR